MVFTERQKVELKNISQEVIKTALNEFMNDNVFLELVSSKVADIVSKKISVQGDKLITSINVLETKINDIQDDNKNLRRRVADLEQKSKLNLLRVYGIQENKEDLKSNVKTIFEATMGTDSLAIEQCYRIGNRTKSNKPRAVIVKFQSMTDRNLVFFNKKKFKGSKIVIVEELVKSRYDLYLMARDNLGKGNVWTVEGNIFTKVDGKKVGLKTEEDVMEIAS